MIASILTFLFWALVAVGSVVLLLALALALIAAWLAHESEQGRNPFR